MQWYYAVDKQQQGPFSAEQFAELVRQGVVTAETRVWRAGMPAWLPYAQVAGSAGGNAPAGAPPLPGSALPTPEQWERSLGGADAELEVGECFKEGWGHFKRHMPMAIGTTLLVWLALVAISVVPVLGGVGQMVVIGPLFGGLACYYLRLVRGEEARVGDAFCAFGPRFVPAMVAGLVVSLINAICLVPFGIVLAGIVISQGSKLSEQFPTLEAFMAHPPWGLLGIAGIGLFLSAMLSMVAATLLQFSYALVLDKGLDAVAALRVSARQVWKNFATMFLIVLLGGVLSGLGTMLCLVGALFTVPWFLAAMAVAYERLFPGKTAKPAHE